ncbi:DUF6456 domain-containing protein [Methyloceanibacter methanicus]|uniref:DUF6456 domain-containing protein n=1 Tax=Methyloceanibacter methanicus TaxID=1774968 RepID=UPI00114D3415|nr:DUF6456 domain-containing protein [Methyloceanibacter methanicus]
MSARGQARGLERRAVAELKRLLDRLAGGGAITEDSEGGFRVVGGPGRGAVANTVSRQVMEACLAGDLLEREARGWVLSDAGYARVRRNEAGGDEPFRAQHQRRTRDLRDVGGARRTVLVNDGESPLGWLRSRKDRSGRPLIGPEQFDAGERLRADYWFAQMSARVTANWSAPAPHDRARRGASANGAGLRDEVLAAKDRVMRALAAVGPEVSGVLVDVCCELKGLEEAEKKNGWPQRAGKVVLQIALTRLAKHYGLIVDGKRRKLRHWGDAGYRPRIGTEPEEPNRS